MASLLGEPLQGRVSLDDASLAHAMNSRTTALLRPLVRLLPPLWRLHLRRWWYARRTFRVSATGEYEGRIEQEVARFSAEEVVNDLPDIFHYWSNTHLRPLMEPFGFSYPEDFFALQIQRQAAALDRHVQVISIGAGNCDSEVHIATLLRERGVTGFTITCLDLTDAMLQRGRQLAEREGLLAHFRFVHADFNQWQPAETYDVVMANQSLHHVTNLEGLFDAIHSAIGPSGVFATSDMIGRNGHRRWPEALNIVREFWNELPSPYRYNVQLRRKERTFKDWDCSLEGFEGIRAQDILPLLLERFGFDFFLAYGNVIDPFVDRGFGPHFDPENTWDRSFIDRVHARDEAEILSGAIKPTHMMAVMRQNRSVTPVTWRHMTPQFCLRAQGA